MCCTIGVVAQVVVGAVAQLLLARRVSTSSRASVGGDGQRLLAEHVLAGLHGVLGDREVQRVGRADVHGVDGRIFQHAAVVRLGSLHAELGGELLGLFDLRLADGVELHIAQPADAFQVNAADEAGSE